jgi:hypothetical protein
VKTLGLVLIAIASLGVSYALVTGCEATDAQQFLGLFIVPPIAVACVGALSRRGMAVASANPAGRSFVGGAAWLSVFVMFVGCGT